MVFYVGVKKRATWRLSDMAARTDLDLTSGLTLQWAFRFANDDLVKVDGNIDANADTVAFLTPADVFTLDRQGVCYHNIRIKESVGVDDLTDDIKDKVILSKVGTPAQIDSAPTS